MAPSRTVLAWSLAGLSVVFSLIVQCSILTRAPFHEDEAFYTAYSKDILHGKPFLTSEGVEKPPVYFYWQAMFMAVGGEGQAAARLPNVSAILLAISFAFFMARRIYDDVTAGAIAIVLSLSPFYALFGPTAFTDVLAVTLAIGALERLSAKQYFWSGVLAAGSMFCKQYFFLYLGYIVLAMVLIPSLRPSKVQAKQWVLGVVYPSLLVTFWATFLNFPSWNIVRLAREIYHVWNPMHSRWQSLLDWINQCGQVLGSGILNVLFLASAGFLVRDDRQQPDFLKNEKSRWDAFWLFVMVSYIVALGLQRNVPHYERYILVVVVPIGILAGRAFAAVLRRLPSWAGVATAGCLLALLGNSFYTNVIQRGYKHGANYDLHVGLDKAFAYTNEKFPYPDGLLAFEGSGFLQRYYAYRSPYPVLSVTSQDNIVQRFREFAFKPIWLIENTAGFAQLAMEHWPKDFASLWTPKKLFESGRYIVWEMLPNEQFKNRSLTPQALAAGLQRLLKEPLQVWQLGDSRFEIRGQIPIREGIMTSFTSVWDQPEIYDNKAWMAGRLQHTQTQFKLKMDEAISALARRNRNIVGLSFAVDSEKDLSISGTLTKPTLPFRMVIRPTIESGNRIRVEVRSASLGSVHMPGWLCGLANHYIRPQKIKLPHWAGSAQNLQLNPAVQTVTILAQDH